MNERDLETAVLRALSYASPNMGDRPIEPDQPLGAQFDLDEGRFFHALARETGIDIPAEDHSRLATLSGCMEYFTSGLAD